MSRVLTRRRERTCAPSPRPRVGNRPFEEGAGAAGTSGDVRQTRQQSRQPASLRPGATSLGQPRRLSSAVRHDRASSVHKARLPCVLGSSDGAGCWRFPRPPLTLASFFEGRLHESRQGHAQGRRDRRRHHCRRWGRGALSRQRRLRLRALRHAALAGRHQGAGAGGGGDPRVAGQSHRAGRRLASGSDLLCLGHRRQGHRGADGEHAGAGHGHGEVVQVSLRGRAQLGGNARRVGASSRTTASTWMR